MVAAVALKALKSAYHTWSTKKGAIDDSFFDLYADTIDFQSIAGGVPAMAFTQAHSNKEAVKTYFAELAKDWEMLFYHIRNYLAQGNTVAVLCECCWRHRRTGRIVHSPKLDLYEFKGKQAVRFFEYFDNELAISACAGQREAKDEKPPKPLYPEKGARIFTELTVPPEVVKRVKAHYRQWDKSKGKSVEIVLSLLAPKVSWGSLANGAGELEFTRERLTRDEVASYLTDLIKDWKMDFYRVDKYIAAGPFVLALGNVAFTNRKTGKTARMPKADLWQFARGKAIEFFEYYDTAAAHAASKA